MSSRFADTLQQWSEIAMRRSMHEFIQFMRGAGLSMPQISALIRIHHRGRCQVTEIGQNLEISSPAASQLIQKLVEQGYLERSESVRDRRVKHVSLTHKGESLVLKAIASQRQWIENLSTQLNPGQQETIRDALIMLIQAAQSEDQDLVTQEAQR